MEPLQKIYTGISASSGIAIGKAYFLDRDHVIPVMAPIGEKDVKSEILRFQHAIRKSVEEIRGMRASASGILGEKHLYLFDTHALLLEDDLLIEGAKKRIRDEKMSAEWAFHLAVENCIQLFLKTDNEYLRERKNDIEQVKNKVLFNLAGRKQENLANIKEPVILIAHDLQPSDIVQMSKSQVLGFVTEVGGRATHVGIMASALEIPAIVGISPQETGMKSGDAVILDGFTGKIYINPSPETFKEFLEKQQRIKYYEKKLLKNRSLPAETKDGFRVKLMANIEYSRGVEMIRRYGAEGVGLFRTEYLFMNRKDLPDEEEQFQEYKRVAEALKPDPVIIRTMDLGGDKPAESITVENEKNPALGLRAIRISLRERDVFKVQLRAILRASCHGNVKVMFPMISGVDELRDAKDVLHETQRELEAEGVPFNKDIPIGIMIEIPSSTNIADLLAREVDFFSIGTNDLIQYALAVDRGNKNVAYLYKPLHPAILRMIKNTIEEANRAGIEVGICGEMGGNIANTMALLGLGKIDEISMDSHSIPKVKKMVRSITLKEARKFAGKIMALGSTDEIESFVRQKILEKFPEDFSEESIGAHIN